MTAYFLRRVGRFDLIGCCTILVSSCGLPRVQAPTDPALGARAEPPARMAQLNFGHQAVFARCVPPACPTRTLKTLSAETLNPPSHNAAILAPDESVVPDRVVTKPAPRADTTPAVTIQFTFGSARLSPATEAQLDDAMVGITAVHSVTITGRTDSTGPLAVNEGLALARAHAVRDHLLKTHPALASSLLVQAQGPCCFVAPNDTLAGRAQNRRVEVIFHVEDRP